MADLGAITEAVACTLEESRIEAARVLIVDQEMERHDSVLSTFRPQARNPPNQDPRSHIQDGKYAVFFDNVSTFLSSSLRTILDQRLILGPRVHMATSQCCTISSTGVLAAN
jgi:hypothetical protein